MIIDSINNLHKYTSLHPLFAQAAAYIQSTDLLNAEIGKSDIADGLKAIYSDKAGVAEADSAAKFECHNQNIDIQVCIRGNERIGWRSRLNCKEQKGEYNAEKDVLFYADAPELFFNMTGGHFVIFFPEDVHAPMIALDDQPIKKLVIKVKI